MGIQGWFPLRFTGFDLLAIQGTFRSFLQHHSLKASIFWQSAFLMVQLSQPFVTALTTWTFVGRVMSLLFNILSRYVIAFLPRINCLLISWLQSSSTVILEPKKRKSVTTFTFSLSIFHEVMGLDAMILFFFIVSFKPALSLSSFILIKRLFNSSSLSGIRVVSSIYLRLLMFLPPILIPGCDSSSPAFLMMCSAYRLNKQVTADCPVVLLSQSWTNQLLLDPHAGFSGDPKNYQVFLSLL